MKPSDYQDKFTALKNGNVDTHALSLLSRQVANSFMDHYYQNGRYDEGYIDLMCRMATAFEDKDLSKAVSSAFFSVIIEELCDDYEDFQFEAYNRVMSQVISYCRKIPSGKKIDAYLNRFHLVSAEDLVRRASRIHCQEYRFDPAGKNIRRIYLLSRITIGADVAIVSVMVQRLMKLFPEAEIVILGSLKLKEIFGGNSRIRIEEATYTRGGGLLERIESWCSAVDLLEQETADGKLDEVLLIDPDSRITQLGVLPIIEESKYLFFNSHKESSSKKACMAEHANIWMDQVFGRRDFAYPKLWLESGVQNTAKEITQSLRANGCQRITAVNFGVGGNPRKRMGVDFEKKIICELLSYPKSVVILDQGFGAEEVSSSLQIAEEVSRKGYPVLRSDLRQSTVDHFAEGLLLVEGGIGQIAAVIGCSDEYFGYDSACQHIAAAMAVPTTTIFAGSNNPRFVRRWSACGKTSCRIVHVDTLGHPESVDVDEVLSRLLEERTAATKASPAIQIINCANSPRRVEENKSRLNGQIR